MPLPKRRAGVPLGPKGSNGRRLKTQAEKEATKRQKAARTRKADLARQARDPRAMRQAREPGAWCLIQDSTNREATKINNIA